MSLNIAVLDPKASGKIGLYAISYYLLTTILAAILGKFSKLFSFRILKNDLNFKGIILVVTIKPGDKETKSIVGEGTAKSTTTTQDAIMDLIRYNFFLNFRT